MKTETQTQQTTHAHAAEDLSGQSLSALIDGELPNDLAQQRIKQLSQNDGEHARVAEYLAIGDAMRGLYEHPAAQRSDFTHRVMDALKNEPVVLAPIAQPVDRRPALWLAAATMAAITWGLWQSSPRDEINAPLAALHQPAAELSTSESAKASPYLAAHQDFAQAVIAAPEMHFSKAALEIRQ